jgi:tight adherence protein C
VDVLLPLAVFVVVLAGALAFVRRPPRVVTQLNRHAVVGAGGASAAVRRTRTPILSAGSHASAVSGFAVKLTRDEVKTKAAKQLLEAGNPMPLATFLLLRVVFMFGLTPLFVLYIVRGSDLSIVVVVILALGIVSIPNLPTLYVRRKARKRAREIEHAMPDAIDLLVVCVEGGLSLDGGIIQVAQRTSGLLADELRRLQSEVANGMSRRDALRALSARTQAESLGIFCTTIVQAERMGMSVAATLRTLAGTMRTRRRQAAETQARKAPIKMLPFLIFFMIPSVFIVILTPAVIMIYQFFTQSAPR